MTRPPAGGRARKPRLSAAGGRGRGKWAEPDVVEEEEEGGDGLAGDPPGSHGLDRGSSEQLIFLQLLLIVHIVFFFL